MTGGAHSQRLALVLILAISVAGVIGCGDDDNGDTTTTETAAGPDPARYCELVKELDRAGMQAFKPLEQDPKATKKDFVDAEKRFVQDNRQLLDELQQAAPYEIKSEVQTLNASLEGRAGLGPKVPDAESRAAEQKVRQLEKQIC